MDQVKGKVWVFGDNVDTDQIIPAERLVSTNLDHLNDYIFEKVRPGFAQEVGKGDILIAGRNFGCGSSREHAPLVLKECGVGCIIAKSFARIFYRNAINIGLPILECEEAADGINAGDEIEVDFDTGLITDLTTGRTYQAEPFPAFIQQIIRSGGLLPSLKEQAEQPRQK